MLTYEDKLASDSRWALSEGSRHFENDSAVQHALKRIAKRLGEPKIPYAVAGAMAMFQHGYRRFTEGVDILVTADGVTIDRDRAAPAGFVYLVTTNPHTARKYDMHDESEFLSGPEQTRHDSPPESAP